MRDRRARLLTKRGLRWVASTATVCIVAFAVVYFAFPELLLRAYRVWQRSDAGFERRAVQVDDWTVPYLDSNPGGDQQVVLLVHGFGDNKDNFIDMAAGLTGEYRVVAPDLPGFGETAIRPAVDYTPDLYVATILGLLDQLNISSVHLVGYSMGGLLAVKAAAESPQRFRSLTLLAPAGLRGERASTLEKILDAGKPNPLIYRDRESFERLMRLNFNRRPEIPDFAVRAMVAEGKRRSEIYERVFETILAQLDSEDFKQEIASLQVPILIVAGEEDQIVAPSAANHWQAIHPDIDLAILPGASHALVHQRSETIRELLLSRLSRVDNSSNFNR